jgi:hypothetical protein
VLQCIAALLIARRHGATVSPRVADRLRERWAEATTQQDGATLGYDPTGRSYAADRSPRGKTDGMGHVMRRPRHHYPVPAFNVLAFV